MILVPVVFWYLMLFVSDLFVTSLVFVMNLVFALNPVMYKLYTVKSLLSILYQSMSLQINNLLCHSNSEQADQHFTSVYQIF